VPVACEVDGCRLPRQDAGAAVEKGMKAPSGGPKWLKSKLDTSVKNKAREQATEKKNNSKNKVYTIKKKATKRKAKCNDDRDGGKNDAMMSCV